MSEQTLSNLIFSNCVSEFLFERKTRNRTTGTILSYKNELGWFSNWLDKNNLPTKMSDITTAILRRYFVDLATHRTKGGIHFSYRVIKAFFNWYEFEYEPDKNPIKKVKIQANNIEPLPEIPLEDVQKLLNICEGRNKLRDVAILKTLVDTGARASELLALNIEDINLTTGQVNILHGKGDKFRTVWLGEKGRESIKKYYKTREDLSPNSPIFINGDGERLKFFGLRQIILRLCHRAIVREYGLHCFRRTFALTMYRKGVDIVTISRLLGHSKIEVTRRYLNVSNDDLREAHAKASPADSLD